MNLRGGYPKKGKRAAKNRGTGRIIKYKSERGFGFIQPDDKALGERIFFHIRFFRGYRSGPLGYGIEPKKGDRVSFELDMYEDYRGPRASSVEYVNKKG